jgi:hypothetical protein
MANVRQDGRARRYLGAMPVLVEAESPLAEGRRYQAMIDGGMTVEEIAEMLFTSTVSRIKRYLELVRMSEDPKYASLFTD